MLGPGNTKAYAVGSLYPGLPAWRGTWAHLMRQHVDLFMGTTLWAGEGTPDPAWGPVGEAVIQIKTFKYHRIHIPVPFKELMAKMSTP